MLTQKIFGYRREGIGDQRSLCLLHLVGFSLTKLLKSLEELLFEALVVTTILYLHLAALALKWL